MLERILAVGFLVFAALCAGALAQDRPVDEGVVALGTGEEHASPDTTEASASAPATPPAAAPEPPPAGHGNATQEPPRRGPW